MNDKAYKFSTRDDTTFRVDGGGGAGSGVMVVDIEFGPPEEVGGSPIQSLNKTWQEILDAMTASTPVLVRLVAPEGSGAIGAMMYLIEQAVYSDSENAYVVSFSDQVYYTSTADGYPVYGRK